MFFFCPLCDWRKIIRYSRINYSFEWISSHRFPKWYRVKLMRNQFFKVICLNSIRALNYYPFQCQLIGLSFWSFSALNWRTFHSSNWILFFFSFSNRTTVIIERRLTVSCIHFIDFLICPLKKQLKNKIKQPGNWQRFQQFQMKNRMRLKFRTLTLKEFYDLI